MLWKGHSLKLYVMQLNSHYQLSETVKDSKSMKCKLEYNGLWERLWMSLSKIQPYVEASTQWFQQKVTYNMCRYLGWSRLTNPWFPLVNLKVDRMLKRSKQNCFLKLLIRMVKGSINAKESRYYIKWLLWVAIMDRCS